jgi:hypothetical protein
MPNLKGNVESLKPYESKWLSGKTRTIRVPVALVEQILSLARQLDAGEPLDMSDVPDAATLLNQLKAKRKKSKCDIADVEAILDMLGLESPS